MSIQKHNCNPNLLKRMNLQIVGYTNYKAHWPITFSLIYQFNF